MHRTTEFLSRHLGPRSDEMRRMLEGLQLKTLEDLANSAVPASIRLKQQLDLPQPLSEQEALDELKGLARKNIVFRSLIGTGYSGCITPAVIQRNLLENPGWYTQYTPYQAEIAQGRLEALLNFQTLVSDLTGLPIANASLLDEGTAVAEAMAMAYSLHQRERKFFFISEDCHPQVIEVVRTRAEPLGVKLVVGQAEQFKFDQPTFGVVVQYPNTQGTVRDYSDFFTRAKAHGAFCIASADLLALTLVKTPGEMGADIAVGSVQRFGVPVGFGGPHAAYFSTKDEFKRVMPGRLVGVSKDAQGRLAYRLALQTREQHIRREKATSNICTAQVLLANIASMYAVYHGAEGLTRIAKTVQMHALQLEAGLKSLGYTVVPGVKFDTVAVLLGAQEQALVKAEFERSQINLRFESGWTGVSLDEITNQAEVLKVLNLFAAVRRLDSSVAHQAARAITDAEFQVELARKTPFLEHSVFKAYRSETEMQRYIRRLESRDLSLTHSMIPLGSCTMKLNAASELMPITWPEFGSIHPFAPQAQWQGYATMLSQLESWLSEITGFAAVSLQPNAGSQGEFAGLLVIREYHRSKGNTQRDVCLIPKSAHGTNPASAVMAGMRVVVVDCDVQGNVDVADLKRQAEAHKDRLAALMITYPSTHGVFETSIREICEIIHSSGGLVYMDGANMNAQVGLCRPGDFGPDVCHLNLHKTFCIPHGGGGPGMGPIGVAAHLKPFLPGHPLVKTGGSKAIGPISSAPYGSASILPISWMYIRMMGAEGLKQATQVAILNANYVAEKLDPHYPVLYRGINGRVAHECIVDLRQLKSASGVEVEDVAKRLMDYGFHAPTVSFPVPGTLMIEPTESESLAELERFCEAMISIRQEIQEIIDGKADSKNNVLKMAPHTAAVVTQEKWDRPYSREKAVYPAKYVRENKFWPHVGRIDNVYGDRNLICSCAPIEDYQTSS